MKYLYLFWLLVLHIYCESSGYAASLEYTLLGHQNVVEKSAVSNNSKILASGDWDGAIHLWSIEHGIKIGSVYHEQKITGLHFVGRYLVSTSIDGTMCVWNTKTQKQLYQWNHPRGITHLQVSTDQKMAIIIDQNLQVFTINLQTKKQNKIMQLQNKISLLCVTNDNKILIANKSGNIFLATWQGNISRAFATHSEVTSLDVYKNYLFTASANRQVKVWHNKNLTTSFGVEGSIRQIFFINEERLLIYSIGNVYLYSLTEKKLHPILESTFFYRVERSRNWKYLIGLGDKKVNVYRLLSLQKKSKAFRGDIVEYIKNNLQKTSKALPSGVLILPFTNDDGLTTRLGSLLAIMSMFSATYTPQKVMDLRLQKIEDFFYEQNWLLPQQKLQSSAIENAKSQFNIENTITGKLIRVVNGYELHLSFSGNFPPKNFKKTFVEIKNIPLWVATKVHECIRLETTQVSQKVSSDSIMQLAEIYAVYYASRFTTSLHTWKKVVEKNPESTFIASHYAYSYSPDHTRPIWHLLKLQKKFPQHTYINCVVADFYLKEKQNIKALNIYMSLLAKDSQNPKLYSRILHALSQEDHWDVQRLVLLYCQGSVEDLYWYNVIAADHYINYAWDALPQTNGKTIFQKKMKKAQEFLEVAYRNNPHRWQAPTYMIKVATALKNSEEVVEKWFQRAVKNGNAKEAYWQKFHYTTPRWHGNKEKMLAFVRSVAKNAFAGSPLRFLILDAHRELLPGENYYASVWDDIELVFAPYLKVYPRDRVRRIWYWEYAMLAKRYDVAAREYLALHKLGQRKSLYNSASYQTSNKVPMYFALADIFQSTKDKNNYLHWLRTALHYEPRNWKYQKQYVDYLLKEQHYSAAYEHLQALAQNDPTTKEYATEQMKTIKSLRKAPVEIPLLQTHTLHIITTKKFPENLRSRLHKDIAKKFKINVAILPQHFALKKKYFIAERENKLKESLQRLYRIVGKNKVEAYRSVYGIDKDSDGDFELLRVLLEKTPRGKQIIEDLEKNYRDRWNTSLIVSEIKKIPLPPKSLGTLLLLNEEIGNLEKGTRFSFATAKVAVVSGKRFRRSKSNLSTSLYYERIFKVSCHAVARILDIPLSTLAQCPLSYSSNLFALDTQSLEFSYESKENIRKLYQKLRKD